MTDKKISSVPIDDIKPNPKNANKHPAKQMTALIKNIERNGIYTPLVVSANSGLLNAGHARLSAARQLNFTHVDVIFKEFRNETHEYECLIGVDNVAKMSQLDLSSVNLELENLDSAEIDFSSIGLSDFTIECPVIDIFSKKQLVDKIDKFLLVYLDMAGKKKDSKNQRDIDNSEGMIFVIKGVSEILTIAGGDNV